MKLIDRIRVEGIKPVVPTADAQEHAARLTKTIRTSSPVVILADNVADYFYQQYGEEQMVGLMKATNAAPPFESFWIEWRQRDRDGVRRQVGCLFTPVVTPDEPCFQLRRTFDLQEEEMAWVLRCEVVDADTPVGIRGPIGIYTIPVGEQGGLPWDREHPDPQWPGDMIPIHRQFPDATEGLAGRLSNRHIVELAEQIPLEIRSQEIHDQILDLLRRGRELDASLPGILERYAAGGLVYVFCSLVTLTFMHCRNVEMVEQRPPEKLARKHRKHKGVELSRWHVLQIDPMRNVLRTEGGIDQGNSLAKALHICRGHFATYSPERPLFGRPQSGPVTVWHPMHVKGRAERGHDQHDYEVKAPSETSGR